MLKKRQQSCIYSFLPERGNRQREKTGVVSGITINKNKSRKGNGTKNHQKKENNLLLKIYWESSRGCRRTGAGNPYSKFCWQTAQQFSTKLPRRENPRQPGLLLIICSYFILPFFLGLKLPPNLIGAKSFKNLKN